MEKLGIGASFEEIFNSGFAAASFLKSIGFDKKAYLIGEKGLGEEFDELGLSWRGLLEHATIPDPLTSLEFIEHDKDIGAIVVGLDRSITYPKLAFANFHLQNNDCLLVATNDDPTYPSGSRGNVPGAGSIMAMIQTASGIEPTVCGKPSQQLFDVIKSSVSLVPSKSLMVGDRLSTDILWGNTMGMDTLLVLTGVTTSKDLELDSCVARPSFIASSLGELHKFLTY